MSDLSLQGPKEAYPSAADDHTQPFLLESSGIRGRLLRLGPVADTILSPHGYVEPVAGLLGEMLALTGALSSLLKFEGIFTAQAKGDGPVSLLVSDITAEGDIRGYASCDTDRLTALLSRTPDPGLGALMGKGYFACTVDLAKSGDRYQGIVELTGETLADCLQHYFLQSDQVQSGILLASRRIDGRWRSGALVLQRVPEEGGGAAPLSNIDDEEAWRRAMILQVTCTAEELLDPALPAHDLLYRLFHEEGVRVFSPRPVKAECRCSRARIETVLAALPREDVAAMKVDGHIEATCEFCNRRYRFDDAALAELFD